MRVNIVKTGINGEGIAFYKEQPLFVAGAIEGECVEVAVTHVYKTYRIAKLVKIVKKSKDRRSVLCEHNQSCGACTLMHIRYEKQLEIKESILHQALKKYSSVEQRCVQKICPSESELGYRNSIKLPFHMKGKQLQVGMYARDSHRFASLPTCIVHERELDKVKGKVVSVVNKHHMVAYSNGQKDGLRYLVIRGFEDKFQLCIVSGVCTFEKAFIDDIMQIQGVVSLYQSINPTKKTVAIFGKQTQWLAGNKKLNFTFMDFKLSLLPRSFFQLNTKQAMNLYRYVDDFIGEDDQVVEAYSGIGVMSLLAARKGASVVGIENVKDAVHNARSNAKRNGYKDINFEVGDAALMVRKFLQTNIIDVLIVDPPRSGMDDAMIDTLMQSDIKKIIYVSCNPSTLAKNLHRLSKCYCVERIAPVDMFPNTSHVETCVLLSHKNSKHLHRPYTPGN